MWNGLPVIIFGTGGMARETKIIIDEINKLGYEKKYDILGYISEKNEDLGKRIDEFSVIASDETLESYISGYKIIGAILPMADGVIKKKVYERIKEGNSNIVYPNIISPKANIMDSDSINIGFGNIIYPGVIITTNIKMGDFNIINMNSTIGHDVEIGSFCTVNPLSAISGNVKIDFNVLVGASSAIKQGVKISENTKIGLGAFVVKNVKENEVVVCKPASRLRGKKIEE